MREGAEEAEVPKRSGQEFVATAAEQVVASSGNRKTFKGSFKGFLKGVHEGSRRVLGNPNPFRGSPFKGSFKGILGLGFGV